MYEQQVRWAEYYGAMEQLRKEDRPIIALKNVGTVLQDARFYKVTKLTYEKEFPRLEAFENVVASIKSGCRLVYYLCSGGNGVDLYIGVIPTSNVLDSIDYGELLKSAIKGNFLGTELVEVKEMEAIPSLLESAQYYSSVLGIPSRNKEKEDISFQGVDRLINIMAGKIFHLLVIWEPVPVADLWRFEAVVKDSYANFKRMEKETIQESKQESKTTGHSSGKNASVAHGKNEGWSEGHGQTHTKGISGGSSETHTEGTNTQDTSNRTWGTSTSISYEKYNKFVGEIIKYIDEELLPRLGQGHAKGMYRTAIYLASDTPASLRLLENSVTSIYQGEKSTFFPLKVCPLPEGEETRNLVRTFSIYRKVEPASSLLPLCSRPILQDSVDLATWLTPAEVSVIAGLPQKEVPGIELRQQVSFGLNIKPVENDADRLFLGHIRQEGSIMENRAVYISRRDLDKHTIICGTTGSGKTTTCHSLLHGANMPFMVIEPAKTEYRVLCRDKKFADTIIFTVNMEDGVPFRFNPFEFLPEENLSSHVDQLKACFMASCDMEAAIPNLLKEGLDKVYEQFGWNFRNNENRFLANREEAWKCGGRYFPTISDYITVVENLVDKQGFDDRLKNDYRGSIRARLNSLRTGSNALMFDTRVSVDFNELLDKKVILELEQLKSGEDKSFLMGLILGRLSEALKARHKVDPGYRHITLVEEAHRLLTRSQPGDSPNRKQGVEMFADLLAEVRKYGESLIIVDQIPSKLAPEVLKNTNTKIIHKLFARDDKETVGDAMALDEQQRNYLSYLDPGETIIFSQGWKKPVNVQIEQLDDVKTDEDVPDEEAFVNGIRYWQEHADIFCPDLPRSHGESSFTMQQLREVEESGDALRNIIERKSNNGELWVEKCNRLRELLGDTYIEHIVNILVDSYIRVRLFRISTTEPTREDIRAYEKKVSEYAKQYLLVKENPELDDMISGFLDKIE